MKLEFVTELDENVEVSGLHDYISHEDDGLPVIVEKCRISWHVEPEKGPDGIFEQRIVIDRVEMDANYTVTDSETGAPCEPPRVMHLDTQKEVYSGLTLDTDGLTFSEDGGLKIVRASFELESKAIRFYSEA